MMKMDAPWGVCKSFEVILFDVSLPQIDAGCSYFFFQFPQFSNKYVYSCYILFTICRNVRVCV